MEAEDSKLLVDGGDACQNGFPDEAPPSPAAGKEKEEDDRGETIKTLRVKIEGLKKKQSDLLAEMERSEAEKKELAAHASFLEGEISRLQIDLLTAESSVADSQAETELFRQALDKLDAEKSMLESRVLEQGGELDVLRKREEEFLELKKEVEAKEKAREKMEAEMKKKIQELAREVKMNVELEKAAKELEERVSGLQIEVEERELVINGHVDAQKSFKLPSASQVAAVFSAGSVAGVVAAAIYLRCVKQR